jgi:hypothetical protein
VHWRKSTFSGHNGSCVEIAWRKSSFSSHNGTCVEVAHLDPMVGIRDSKNTSAGHLTLTSAGWSGLVSAVKGGTL